MVKTGPKTKTGILGFALKGGAFMGSAPKNKNKNKRDKDKHKTSNKAWDWEDDLNDADLSRLRICIYGHKMDAESQRSPYTGIKGHRQTDTEISIYGHKMDANRQISPYMGIHGHKMDPELYLQ